MSTDLKLNVQLRDLKNSKLKLKDEIVELPEKDACKLVLSGEAELSLKQNTPPFALLAIASEFVDRLGKIGPLTSEPSTFENVNQYVFRNGLRQTMVGGEPLYWYSSIEETKQMAETCLCACSEADSNIFSQLNAICISKVRKAPDVRSIYTLSKEYMKKENLVLHPRNSHVFDFDDTHYHKLSPDWFQFYYELETLNERVHESFNQAIFDGRILVAEETTNGDRLIFPELALEGISNTRSRQFHFLLTRDLPKKWYQRKETVKQKKARATRWLERAYREIDLEGKRWSGKDVCIVLVEEFDLSEDAAKDVWRKADIPNRGQLGNISKSERADINKLREFK